MNTLRVVGLAVLVGAFACVTGCPATDNVCDFAGACTLPDASDEASRPDATRGDAKADAPVIVHDGGAHTDGSVRDAESHDAHTADAAKDVAVDSFVCDPSKTPSEDACVISESLGVFVAPTGNDTTGKGTRAEPYATIATAISSAGSKRVYACAGTYPAPLAVTTSVAIFGGLACPESAGSDAAVGGGAAWSYTGGLATVAPSTTSVALTITGATNAHFEDMAFTAQNANLGDAGVHGAASIAVLVNSSTGVNFTRVTATAGAGVSGANAGEQTSNWCSDAGIGGSPANGGLNGGSCSCQMFGSSKGGSGGGVTQSGLNGSSVPVAYVSPAVPDVDGVGGTGNPGPACHNTGADPGANGSATLDGGALGKPGSLSTSGWTVTTAGGGAIGNPGQGGGGGGGTSTIGGAGGGAGGCGGTGGPGGSGGGASVAIAVVASDVSYSDVTLMTSNGGNGGSGSSGQAGQAGGASGTDPNTSGGCSGGVGGAGAGGGGGGGGSGGPSVGVGWAGDASLRIDDASVTNATTLNGPSKFTGSSGGTGGVGGSGGAAASGTGAVPGASGAKGPSGTLAAVAPL